jgi:hypothetical protein
MQLEGLHHITMVTGDARKNVVAPLLPGFAIDEDPERLGEELRVPKMHAHLRERLERTLTPLVNPRTARRDQVTA